MQITLRAHPQWRRTPTVVVESIKPTAPILWVNRAALHHRIHPGMRFAQAQSLLPELRAATVTDDEIQSTTKDLHKQLLHFSPSIEPSTDTPGDYWIDPRGLTSLHDSLEDWAHQIHQHLHKQQWSPSLVLGFERHRTHFIARCTRGVRLLQTPEEEATLLATIPIAQLGLNPKLVTQWDKLGITTLGHLMEFTPDEVRTRFGHPAARLLECTQATATQGGTLPIQPKVPVDPITVEIEVTPPDDNVDRLLFGIAHHLETLLRQLSDRGQTAIHLHITLHLEHHNTHIEHIQTAAPTLNKKQWMELTHIRFNQIQLHSPVHTLHLQLDGQQKQHQQIDLLEQPPERDLDAGSRALARLKALFGAQAVTHAQLRDLWLPENTFEWIPTTELRPPIPMNLITWPPPCTRQLHSSPQRHNLPQASSPQTSSLQGRPGIHKAKGAKTTRPHSAPQPLQRMESPGWHTKPLGSSMPRRDYQWVQTPEGTWRWAYSNEQGQWFEQGVLD